AIRRISSRVSLVAVCVMTASTILAARRGGGPSPWSLGLLVVAPAPVVAAPPAVPVPVVVPVLVGPAAPLAPGLGAAAALRLLARQLQGRVTQLGRREVLALPDVVRGHGLDLGQGAVELAAGDAVAPPQALHHELPPDALGQQLRRDALLDAAEPRRLQGVDHEPDVVLLDAGAPRGLPLLLGEEVGRQP